METDVSDLSLHVDLGRYPLGEAESAAYRACVDEAAPPTP